jgi:hypothetical protein
LDGPVILFVPGQKTLVPLILRSYDKKVTLVTAMQAMEALKLLQVVCNNDATFLQ